MISGFNRYNKKIDKRAFGVCITKRAKILCFISWVFDAKIIVPDYELEARTKKYRSL